MANFLSDAFKTFQDTFSLTNGAALVRSAAAGKSNTNFNIGFTSLGSEASIDTRVRLQIPKMYMQSDSRLTNLSGDNNQGWGGIYFPVTPSIKQDSKANWSPSNVQHTNYAVHSYVNSDVGAISVSGQFPVQTQEEAIYWVSTVHALRSITKMRTGQDSTPGAPPPVCRFFAYGQDMFYNVPVVVSSFSIDLPADVDYITGYNYQTSDGRIDIQNKVPTLSTISLTLLPVYSRREMNRFTVDAFVRGDLSGAGYL
jgi:hypothetical protein